MISALKSEQAITTLFLTAAGFLEMESDCDIVDIQAACYSFYYIFIPPCMIVCHNKDGEFIPSWHDYDPRSMVLRVWIKDVFYQGKQ